MSIRPPSRFALAALALSAPLVAALAGCDRADPVVAQDRAGPIRRSACLELLGQPASWAPELANAVGLDESEMVGPGQIVAAARYLSAARCLRAGPVGAATVADPAIRAALERTEEELLLLLLEERFLGRATHVDQRTIEEYYREHAQDFTEPPLRTFRHLFVPFGPLLDGSERTREEAQAIAEEARAGARAGKPFAAFVRVASESIGGQPDGKVGPVRQGVLRREIDRVVWSLEPGEIGDVIVSGSGVHVIHLLEARPSHVRPLADVEQEVVTAVLAERTEDESRRLLELVALTRHAEYHPEHAEPVAPATAVVLRLGDELYSRARCDRWLASLPSSERDLYRAPERRAAYIREQCERLLRLAAARDLGIPRTPRFQERLRQESEAVVLSILLERRLDERLADDPDATVALVVADCLERASFQPARAFRAK